MTEDEAIHQSIINSYNIIVNKVKADDIIEEGGDAEQWFYHHPDEPPTLVNINDMIELLEEYERCAKLKDIAEEMTS